jgi:Xaa-Pro aminopeptidase
MLLERERLDALWVTDPANIRYLCGFTGSNGLLLVLRDEAVFFTDSRYTLQAGQETTGVSVRECRDLDGAAAEVVDARGVGYVGAEGGMLPHARWQRVRRLCTDADVVDVGAAVSALRRVKSAAEVAKMRRASQVAEEAMLRALATMRIGSTERDVAVAFQCEALALGADGLSFDTIIAAGARGALPHAQPGSRAFAQGDLVVVDFGVRVQGYCSDQTVTVPVGAVAEEARQVYEVVLRAQRRALHAVRAGVALREVDSAARTTIGSAGYADLFGHGTGHGVGLEIHEAPTVGPRGDDEARVGDVFTVEPGIYVPNRFGVRLEDTVVVTADGFESITTLPKDFGAVWDVVDSMVGGSGR